MYLVGKRVKSVAHIWTGEDTLCRMYSTGGMRKRGKTVSETCEAKALCKICQSLRHGKSKSEYRIYIDVPYAEKDMAKDAGARWDSGAKSWYITDEDDTRLFLKWRRKNT